MKRKILACVTMTVIGLTVWCLLVGCAGTRITQLSGAEFIKQAEQTDKMSSFNWTSYIGSSDQRAYLEYGYPAFIGNGMRLTVYWTPIQDLPSEIVTQIKIGTPPWKNWRDRITKATDRPHTMSNQNKQK